MTYTQPLLLIFLAVAAAGLWRDRRRPKEPRSVLVALGVAGLFLLSWQPAAWVASLPLEMWYRPGALPADAEAIVVLSGNVLPPRPGLPMPVPDRDTYQRCLYAAWLFHNWKQVPVIASGGAGEPGEEPFAATMKRVLLGEGVPPDRIWIEGQSHSTWENAVYSAAILRKAGIRRIALVTEAPHMLRAAGCFRKQGLIIAEVPCCFHFLESSRQLIPSWKAIHTHEQVLHEAGGLLWYWMKGRI